MLEQEGDSAAPWGDGLLQLLLQLKPWPVTSPTHKHGASRIFHGTQSVTQLTLDLIHHRPLSSLPVHIASHSHLLSQCVCVCACACIRVCV